MCFWIFRLVHQTVKLSLRIYGGRVVPFEEHVIGVSVLNSIKTVVFPPKEMCSAELEDSV